MVKLIIFLNLFLSSIQDTAKKDTIIRCDTIVFRNMNNILDSVKVTKNKWELIEQKLKNKPQ